MQDGTNSLRKLRRDWWKTKLCTSCVSPLGRFLSRGGICPQCGLRVCKNCRNELQSGAWVCVLCSDGGMPSDDLAKTTKSLGRDSRSIRRSWTISNPQRAQTNSPILKSYTVLYPEDGVLTDGGDAGGSSTNTGAGCSVSTGHLSSFDDNSAAGSNTKKKIPFGGSDQGINASLRSKTSNNINHRNTNTFGHQAGGVIHKKRNGDGAESNGVNNGDTVNGLANARQFHSLPRMSSNTSGGLLFSPASSSSPSAAARALGLSNKVGKRSSKSDYDKENIKRHRSFQTTLHPYNPSQVNNPPSPSASVNFIEETFWDYYDYELENSSSDPSSTPRNFRKIIATSSPATISEGSTCSSSSGAKGVLENKSTNIITRNKILKPTPKLINTTTSTPTKPSTLVAFRTNSNRSSCERSLGESMDYDCTIKMNQYSSLSDTEINESSKYDGQKRPTGLSSTSSPSTTVYRRHSNAEHPRSSYHYATISSTTNPYLPASEYVYRRRHDHEMLNEAPPKPERKSRNNKRSVSLNAYDSRKFSPLRTYCVLMKENIEPGSGGSSSMDTNTAGAVSKTGPTSTTSAIVNSNSPISLSFTPSSTPLRFNSLPRERIIRIEREAGDGSTNVEKYSSLKFPPRSKNETTLLGRSSSADHHYRSSDIGGGVYMNKNVTRVPIVKDDSNIELSYTSRPNNCTFTSTGGPPPKSKIERSQSYREISTSRPYPHYQHYHPHHQQLQKHYTPHTEQRTNNFSSINSHMDIRNKATAAADLNFMPAGTTSALPNFRSNNNKATSSASLSTPTTSYNVWDSSSNPAGPNNFFRSDFDDGSDVVIENFIKTHSSESNTLPKRKYLPSSTHITCTPRRASADDGEYQYHHHYKENPSSTISSDFTKKESIFHQQDSAIQNNNFRQCSTFPRGISQRSKTDNTVVSEASQQMQTEQLPNYMKKSNIKSSSNIARNNSSTDVHKGYPCVDTLDVFFQPTNFYSAQVPNQQFTGNNNANVATERILPIKVAGMTGPGYSATLPHPYIRRNKPAPDNNILSSSDKPQTKNNASSQGSKTKDSGPSILEVEMDIERDIYYQKTRSLDRVRPSKLKSVLGFGRSNTTAGNKNDLKNANHHQHYPTMEIDYSKSQPYSSSNNKGRLPHQHLHDNLFSIDQVDRSYANGRSNINSMNNNANSSNIENANVSKCIQIAPTNEMLHPQQVHHSTPTVPIPSPRMKRKAKLLQQQQEGSSPSSITSTLYSPKINEMSSSTSSLIGPGTNGNKKASSSASTTQAGSTGVSTSTSFLNEPDHYNQPQSSKTNASNKSSCSATNPISLGVNTSLNATGGFSSKFSLAKDTSINTDSAFYSASAMNNGSRVINGVDGIIKSEKSTSGTNQISHPPTSASALPNYFNSDNPGVNFMISSVNEFDLQEQQEPFLSSASVSHSPIHKQFSDVKTKTSASVMHNFPGGDHSPLSSPYHHHQQIKSALANNSADSGGGGINSKLNNGGGGGKAVRFEPHIIAMEIESEQRKLLQQQQQQHQQQLSGPQEGSMVNNNHGNNNNSVVNSAPGEPGSTNSSNVVSGMKSNSGNHSHHHQNMHRHGYLVNKGRQHYVHANSYLPVLYHSYHQQHKYIRKGTAGTIAGGAGTATGASLKGGKSKSKKYKGFVARAIAKVKSKAAASIKKGDSSSAVVGKEGNNSKAAFSQQQQFYNATNTAAGNVPSSVITYISPQPLTQHQQPPVQQSLEESSKSLPQEQYQQKEGVPSITVNLTSAADVTNNGSSSSPDANIPRSAVDVPDVSVSKRGILINSPSSGNKIHSATLPSKTKVISESSKKYVVPGGKLSKSFYHLPLHHQKNIKYKKGLPQSVTGINQRRMDSYIDNLDMGDDNEATQGMSIPDSFRLQTDRITPSSTSSSSSSSFSTNLQESYELFHNQTLPERVQNLVTTTTVVAENDDHEGSSDDDGEERFDSLNEDEDSDNEEGDTAMKADHDEDGHFKSFDESDFGEDEDGEADFVFYPTPRFSSTQALGTLTNPNNNASSTSSSARHQTDTDRNKVITSVATSSTNVASYAPFANNNETTTKGNNNIISEGASSQYSDSPRDISNSNNHISNSSMRNKGKFSSSEPKMVVGIPTYRSPNSRTLINSHHQQNHYGKSQASIPNANPTASTMTTPTSVSSTSPLTKSKENVKQASAKTFSSALFKEPHPSHQHQQFITTNNNNNENTSEVAAAGSSTTFGMHQDSLSNNNRHQSSHNEEVNETPLFLSQPGKSGEQYRQTENQVTEQAKPEMTPSQSQAFITATSLHGNTTQKNSSRGGTRQYKKNQVTGERGRNRGGSCEHDAKTNNDDHDHDYFDEDTLQNDVKKNGSGDAYITTAHPVTASADSFKKERVSSVNPHDAKGFHTISTSESSVQGTASATTTVSTIPSSNSTAAVVASPSTLKKNNNLLKKNEGRLTDLTTATITTASRGLQQNQHQQEIRSEPKHEHEIVREGKKDSFEEGLRHDQRRGGTHAKSAHNKNCTDVPYISCSDSNNVWDNKLVTLKSNNSSVQQQEAEQDEESSLLQARTSSSSSPSWANSNSASAPNSSNSNTKRKSQNTVTNTTSEINQNDIERLERLELVKKKQQNILTHINNTSGGNGNLKANFKIPSVEQNNAVSPTNGRSVRTTASYFNNYYSPEQPNSLETQCANDQSFLSESEVSSCGKSPSPSPRFKSRKFAGGNKAGEGGGGVGTASGSKSAGDRDAETLQHHHLLHAAQTRSPSCNKKRQSKSSSGKRTGPATGQEESGSNSSGCEHSEKDPSGSSRPLYYPDCGPAGMSILPPQQQHSTSTSAASSSPAVNDPGSFGKFKSRILLNSDDLEDDEELSRGIADVVTSNKSVNGNKKSASRLELTSSAPTAAGGKKNITTVEISGDVGIVSSGLLHNASSGSDNGSSGIGNSNSSAFDSHHKGSKKPGGSVNKRQIPYAHLQLSGLSLIQQPSALLQDSSDEDSEKPIEPEIRTKLVDQVKDNFISTREELGSSVSANESSGGDNDKVSTSDDNSSDWQSEGANTVIFRGQAKQPVTPSSSADFEGDPASFYDSSAYLDPEIQINNITVGDQDSSSVVTGDISGNGVEPPSLAPTGRDNAEQSSNKTSNNGTVNVGYKATKVNKVSSDLIIGIKKSSTDKTATSSSQILGTDADAATSIKIGSKRKLDKNDASSSSSSSSSSAADSSEELGKSNETLTDIPITTSNQCHPEIPAEQDHLREEMVMQADNHLGNNTTLYVPNATKSPHHRRESPEGQEQEVPDNSSSEEKDNKSSKSKEKSNPKTVISEPIHEQNPAIVPNAKEKKMEEAKGGGGGGGSGDGANGVKSKKHGKSFSRGTISKEKILQNVLSQIPSRSSPDGADADKPDVTLEPEVESPTAGVVDNFDVTSDEDSWVEEILFEDEDDTHFEETVKKLPPPLDLTLHTIVEESESEAENSGNFYQPSTSGLGSQKNQSLSQSESNANELEKYFNFGIYNDPSSTGKNSLPHEESEFSDTFSESSFSLQEDDFDNGTQEGLLDPAELASTRLEKYFYNLGGPQSMMNPIQSTIINQHAADSDSVGSESDSDNSVLEKRKKVLKHHRRSADFDEEFGDKVSDEEDNFGFGQDGFDTIKKTTRKMKKSGSEGSIINESSIAQNSPATTENAEKTVDSSASMFERKSPAALKKSDSSEPSVNEKPMIKVNRSNSFTWSSDEEVNIMMSKLRQLFKNLIKSKAEGGSAGASQQASSSTSEPSSGNIKDKQLVYLESELIRLMKTDNLKNIVEYLSSEESEVDDVYKFIKVVNSSGSTPVDLDDLGDLGDLDIDDPNLLENLQSTMQLQEDGTSVSGVSPKSSPALLAKVMHHIGNRLNMWMKDEGNLEEDNNDDNVTLKCAPSVSSDLNEDRFSWKGSFESALAAKRQSVGSTDSISSSDYGTDKSMLRSSSLHHLTTSQPIEENKEEEEPSSSLPRMTNLCNSLPRLNQPNNPAISRAHSLVMTAGKNEQPGTTQTGTESYPISGPVKSARYRPPGFQPIMKAKRIDTEEKSSPAILSQSTPVLTQDPAILKNRSDSMGNIIPDMKPAISVKGQVEFGLQYNYKLACLEVKVVGCRDLASGDSKRNRSDPYVKAYLLPDKSKAGKRKTKTKKNTLNPVFDEILKFPLTLSDLQNRTLWLSVWHSDMFGKNEFLGEVLVNLKDRVFDDPNPGWWNLQEMSGQMEDMPKGDVVIALKWQPKTDNSGNLSVLVKEAKNLVPVKNGSPSTFVKCALLSDKTRKQKTSICRRSFNPIWNQTLLFEDVDDDGVEITIWNHDLLASHDLIGAVRLEYDNSLWDSMLSRPSFWVEGGLKLS